LNINGLLQCVQDAYAALTGLSIIMFDLQHQPVTKISNVTELAELVLFSPEGSEKTHPSIYIPDDGTKWRRPMIVQTGYWGVKAIVAPVFVEQKVKYWIWAGAFIEEKTKLVIREQCVHVPNSEAWIPAIEHATEQPISAVEQKLHDIEKMSLVCSELIHSDRQKQQYERYFRLLDSAAERAQQVSLNVDNFLHLLQRIDDHIDFLLYIRQQDYEWMVVNAVGEKTKQMCGKPIKAVFPPLSDSQYPPSVACFENPALDPRFSFFVTHGIRPKVVLAYPILRDEAIEGWIVIGSETTSSLPKVVVSVGSIMVKYWSLYTTCELAYVKMDRHFMRLSMLIEIGRAMNVVKNNEEILRMMTDFVVELAYGNFVFTVLKDQKRNIKVYGGAVHEKQITEYYEDVCHRYFETEGKWSNNDIPTLRETKLGRIMEIPFFVHEQLHGVMSVHMKHLEDVKEAEAYVTALISVGTMIMKQNYDYMPKQELSIDVLTEYLTAREMDVLSLLVQGCSNREIADRLFISIHTVKNHITNIFQKIGVNDRSQLIALVYQLNHQKENQLGTSFGTRSMK
jgi:DNA-binding CsgD family transcriptional regulator/ligand-binding sensor protein